MVTRFAPMARQAPQAERVDGVDAGDDLYGCLSLSTQRRNARLFVARAGVRGKGGSRILQKALDKIPGAR